MILEIAFLVVLLLIASLYAGYGGFPLRNHQSQEGFVTFSDDEPDETLDESSKPDDTTDLQNERDKLLQRLTEVQQETHGDPENSTKSSIRVGLERMIAEIDRALEEEGRYVPTETVEAVIRATNRTFRPN
jgi:hypothetical protein